MDWRKLFFRVFIAGMVLYCLVIFLSIAFLPPFLGHLF
jgi:hypothetical protein